MKSQLRGIAIICGFYDMYKHSNPARSTISWRLIKLARSAWAQILLAMFIGLGVTLISLAQLSITGYAIGQMFSGAEVSVVFPLLLIVALIFKRNTSQLAAAGIKGMRINLGLDLLNLFPTSCGSALDAPPLAAWVRCRRFTFTAVLSKYSGNYLY